MDSVESDKNLGDKDFSIRLERWDKSKKERKKEEGKRNVAKFPINNKFINERLDIPSRWPINLRIFVFFFTENNSGLID